LDSFAAEIVSQNNPRRRDSPLRPIGESVAIVTAGAYIRRAKFQHD